MKNQFDDAITALKVRIAELNAETLDMKRTVNSLCKASGKELFYSDSELQEKTFGGISSVKPSQFYGKTPTVAAREYLDMQNEQAVTIEEILEALHAGGFDFEAQGWKNEVMRLKNLSISLGKNTAIFHRLPNGLMGLKKWYPNIKTKKISKTPAANGEELNEETNAEDAQE